MRDAETTITSTRFFTPFLVPFCRAPGFVGRLDELRQIHSLLKKKRIVGIRPANASGTRGIGKTHLALEYACRQRDYYEDGIFWLDATQSLPKALAVLVQKIWHWQITRATDLGREQHLAIGHILNVHFSSDEIRQIAYNLNMKAAQLSEDKQARIQNLLEFCRQHKSIPELISAIHWQRPQFTQENSNTTIRSSDSPYLLEELVEFAFYHLKQRPKALLVIDNLDDLSWFHQPLYKNVTLTSLPCAILFTTHRRDLRPLPEVPLSILPPNMALRLLLRDKERQAVFASGHPEHAQARAICYMMGWLPLTLKIAGAYLALHPHISLNNFSMRLKTEHKFVSVERPINEAAAINLPEFHKEATRVTLQAQWDSFADKAAQRFLLAASQFPLHAILPGERLSLLTNLLQEGDDLSDVSPWQQMLDSLAKMCLIERLHYNQVQVHTAVHGFLQQQMPEAQQDDLCQQMARNLVNAYENVAILEEQSRLRGLEAVKQDILETLALLTDGEADTAKRLEAILALLKAESDNLYRWHLRAIDAFFVQQLYNQALHLQLPRIQERCIAWFKASYQPYLQPAWTVRWVYEVLESTLIGHEDTIRAVAITPDGRRVVSASSDLTVRVWNLNTGRQEQLLEGHDHTVQAVTVSPDGRFIASASSDHTVMVWDMESGQVVHTLRGHEDWVRCVAITPNSRYIVSGSDDLTVRVWEFLTGKYVRTLTGHEAWIRALAITPDSRYVVSASSDRTLRLWHLEEGTLERTMTGHDSMVMGLTVTPDGQYVLSASADRTIKRWRLPKGKLEHTFTGHDMWVRGLAVTPDGHRFVSASSDQTLKLWELGRNGRKPTALQTYTGHTAVVRSVCVTADGQHAVSASSDQTLKVWNLTAHAHQQDNVGHKKSVRAVDVMPNGRYAISASADGTLKIWKLATGEEAQTLSGHQAAVTAVKVLSQGRFALSGSTDCTLKLWDLVKGEALYTLHGHEEGVLSLAVTPDGQRAVSAAADRTLMIWNLATGEEEATLRGHEDWVRGVAITPDGHYALSVADDLCLKQWDLSSGQEVRVFRGHEDWIRDVTLLPNGRFALTASDDRTIKMWDLSTGYEQYNLVGHESGVQAITVTADGARLVSVSADRTMKVWDMTIGQELITTALYSDLLCVAVSPDGGMIVAGDRLGHVYCLNYLE